MRLSDRQRAYVAEYIKDGNATRAASAAGYSSERAPKSSRVASRIAALRKDVMAEAKYGLQTAIAEIDRRLNLAEEANQYSAVAKLQELKLKIHGLMIERHEVTEVGFQLVFGRYEPKKVEIDVTPPEQKQIEVKADLSETAAEDDVLG